MLEIDFNTDDILKIAFAILCGAVVGLEREYKNKSAGLRTMILICLGSTVFTMASQKAGGESDDRIAANIITGIGFIGAGVIFKDGFSVKGLTTASVIWVVAALGMMIGLANYSLSIILTVVIVLVLSLFSFLEGLMDRVHTLNVFNITFKDGSLSNLHELKSIIKTHKLSCRQLKLTRINNKIHSVLEVSGSKRKLDKFNAHLVELHFVQDVLLT